MVLSLEPTPRIELGTSFLPRMRSTTELCGPDRTPKSGIPENNPFRNLGAGGRIRTCEAVKRQIYSLLGLTTPQPLPKRKYYHSQTSFHYEGQPALAEVFKGRSQPNSIDIGALGRI